MTDLPRHDGALLADHAARVLHFRWPCCGTVATHPYDKMRFEAQHPTDPSKWSLMIGECPTCSPKVYDAAHPCPHECGQQEAHSHRVEHFVNCNVPANHPHPTAPIVRDLVKALGKPRMIV